METGCTETEVEIFVVDKNTARQGGAFSEYVKLTLFSLVNMD